MTKIKRALISVYDKSNLVPFAKKLVALDVEIISTGGTAKFLKENKVPVKEVSSITDFPEILSGRVKTLHPKIVGAILAIRDNKQHLLELKENDISPFDMVVVNLYPFEETTLKPKTSWNEIIENIDIGGPTMIRAAAKNYKHVAVIVTSKRYAEIIEELHKNHGAISNSTREKLAIEAFSVTADYDILISQFLEKNLNKGLDVFPETITIRFKKLQDLRYGENPHQKAAFYSFGNSTKASIANAKQLHGKELSFNNILDADTAIKITREFKQPACTIVKHTNPCGVATANNINDAFKKTYNADTVSAFGGIVALNRKVNVQTAIQMSKIFLEIIIAPSFEPKAIKILSKKKNIRLLMLINPKITKISNEYDFKKVNDGMLMQEEDNEDILQNNLKLVTKCRPSKKEILDMLFAWKIVKHIKSNAIVIVKNGTTLGIGAGQMNRVGSVKLACNQAGKEGKGAVLASDGFFPKPDSILLAAKCRITAIIQPGGSIEDKKVIETANKYNLAMIFTGIRHFKH